jgi:hypothetical protein
MPLLATRHCSLAYRQAGAGSGQLGPDNADLDLSTRHNHSSNESVTMTIQSILGVLMLVAGAAALYFGYQASQSISDRFFETFTGTFTASVTWYLIAGASASLGGLVLLMSQSGNQV